jgi:hypothetical protein
MYDDTDTNERRTAGQPTTTDRPDRSRGDAAARGPPRVPWLYRLVRDRSGQSTVVGVALMLAVATIGVTAVVALGGEALTNTQSTADLQRTEHAMTLLDSRGAMAALGESDSQQVTLAGTGRGTYEVSEGTSWIRVKHVNFTDGNNETVFNESLGSVRYTNGETDITYEGGGVWRTEGDATVMVSPPEFHYRDQTLTMPLVRVVGSDTASGRITADVSPVGDASEVTRVYPNESLTYPAPHGEPYDNPVKNGTVIVTVHSDQYRGWATYFEERTEGKLSVNDANQTASVELRTLAGAPGNFEMPLVGESLAVPSVAQEHNVSDFTLSLAPEDKNNNQFQQLHWSLYEQGPNGQQFEIHFASNGRCKNNGDFNSDIQMSLYYRNNSSAPNEEWQTTVDPNPSAGSTLLTVDCDDSVPQLEVDLLSTESMMYEDIDVQGSDNKWHFGNQIGDNDVPAELRFDQHADDAGHGPYDEGSDTETTAFLINHYFSQLGPDFDLTVDAGPGNSNNRVDETVSSGVLWYDTVDGEEFIQFLHVTENKVRIEFVG